MLLPLGQPSELFDELVGTLGNEGKPNPPNCALAFVAASEPQATMPIAALSLRRRDGRDVFISNGTPEMHVDAGSGLIRSFAAAAWPLLSGEDCIADEPDTAHA
ncbi:hypothetical protein NSE01_32280 [Novosphingobium sediminis]|uniref:Uncharacterized protein n=1 Tax=Novosphingobium sediminis TaxID=707214 RepID=A0A512ANX6_9SPHN|nr:hypothetical protein NSE01_32280 [Novosphingobium sediminis]